MLQDTSFGSSTTSPPKVPYSLDHLGSNTSRSAYASQPHAITRQSERQSIDRSLDSHPPPLIASNSDPSQFVPEPSTMSTVLIRKLPRNTGTDAVNGMLLFSTDLIGTDIIRSPYPEDLHFTTAVARFKSSAGAYEAQTKLQGKSVTTRDPPIIVEIQNPISLERRATIDGMIPRQQTGSTSSASSQGAPPPPPGRSRYGSTFQSSDKISPPLPMPESAGNGNGNGHIQSLFSPTSPMTNGFGDRTRISGKSVINNDGFDDDETKELLNDPLAYAKSGQQLRRSSQAQVPALSHFSRLSISTGQNGNHSNFVPSSTTPTSAQRAPKALQPPHSPTNITNMNSGSPYNNMNMPRPQYPPINPADQNPPCNTLYVGNLPMDTSEDELKAIFSKSRGYKRLCFRVKSNGPMCFVEFDDTTYATIALNEMYGYPLHNSVKGGIRLSYSKNPLGVRSGQSNGMAPNGGYSHHVGMGPPGYINNNHNNNGNGNFKATGPPPGIISPPGFSSGNNYARQSHKEILPLATNHPIFSNPFAFGTSAQRDYVDENTRNFSGGLPPSISGKYGRDSRGSISGFTMPR
ncbi:hypothetical protein Q7P35_005455 [Cladosporium inversicolor]